MFYWTVWVIVKLFGKIFFPTQMIGLENLPKGPCILACNHKSYLDPVVVACGLTRRISFVARDSLFKNKLFGWLIRNLEAFPIKRDSADIGSLKEALRRIKRGLPVLLFPEGTRQGSSGDKKNLSGVGFLAAKSSVPVIPIRIIGSDIVLPSGAKFFKRGKIKVYLGNPKVYTKESTYEKITNDIMSSIYSLPAH